MENKGIIIIIVIIIIIIYASENKQDKSTDISKKLLYAIIVSRLTYR